MNNIDRLDFIKKALELNTLDECEYLAIHVYAKNIYLDLDAAPYGGGGPTPSAIRHFKQAFGPFKPVGDPPHVRLHSSKKFGDLTFHCEIMGAFKCEIVSTTIEKVEVPATAAQVIEKAVNVYDCKPRIKV